MSIQFSNFQFLSIQGSVTAFVIVAVKPTKRCRFTCCFFFKFFFYNSELKEKSGKKKEKEKKKTLRGSFPFPNSFHNLFESHRQILTKLNFKSLGEREQRRNKNKSSFALLLIWYLFLSHLPSSITFSFSLPLSIPNSHSKFLFEFRLSKPSLNCSNLGATKSRNLCFLYVSVAFRFGFGSETVSIWGISVIIYFI